MAEAHPVGFQSVMEAKARRAQVIHVEPRFTRTSALADQHVTVQGTDLAFLGGVINYILANNLQFQEYVQAYTNAPFLVNKQYQDTEDLDGLFSGYDPRAAYDRSSFVLSRSVVGQVRPGCPAQGPSRPTSQAPAARCWRARRRDGRRPVAGASALVFQVLETAPRPVHPRHGRADIRRARTSS